MLYEFSLRELNSFVFTWLSTFKKAHFVLKLFAMNMFSLERTGMASVGAFFTSKRIEIAFLGTKDSFLSSRRNEKFRIAMFAKNTDSFFNKMKSNVGSMIRKEHQVFYSIVGGYFIDMMNHLTWKKFSANMVFHNKSMFLHSSIGIVERRIPFFACGCIVHTLKDILQYNLKCVKGESYAGV